MILKFFLKITTYIFLFFISIASYSQDNVDEAYRVLEQACRSQMRNPDSLLIYSQKLLDYSVEHNLDYGKKNAYRLLGFSNSRLKNYEKSNDYYYKALAEANRLNDDDLKNIVYNDLSINYRTTKYFDSSLYYSHKLLKHYKTTRLKKHTETYKARGINMTYMNLGNTFFFKNDLDSAQFYLDKATKGFENTNNWRFATNSLSLLGEVYFQKKDYQQALKITDSSQAIAESNNLKRNYSRNYNLLARIYLELDNTEAYNKYIDLDNEYKQKNVANVDIREGNDSLNKSRIRHERNKKELLVEQKTFYQTLFFRIMIVVLLLGFISFYFFNHNRKNKREVSTLREKLKLKTESSEDLEHATELIHLKSKAVIDANKLQYIKSEGHYLEFYIEDKEKPEVDRISLTKILEILPSQQFVRIHKSYIVNISYIKIINSTKLMLEDGTWINLSRTYKQQLKEMLGMK